MTSKEALSVIRSRLDIACARAGIDNTKLYNIIWEDLEVLEILKSRFNLNDDGFWYVEADSTDFDTNGMENKLIKEWLER